MVMMLTTNFHGAYILPCTVLGAWSITLFTTTPKRPQTPHLCSKEMINDSPGVFTNQKVSRFLAVVIKERDENFTTDLSGLIHYLCFICKSTVKVSFVTQPVWCTRIRDVLKVRPLGSRKKSATHVTTLGLRSVISHPNSYCQEVLNLWDG